MKVGIMGMGIVGGSTAKAFSRAHEILPYDKFKAPFNTEEYLSRLVAESEVAFLCVPTPMKSSGEIDYTSIHDSLESLELRIKKHRQGLEKLLVVVRSTAVSGTTDKLAEQYNLRFAFNPEFLTEKNAVKDMENTSKVILGVESQEDVELLDRVYRPLFPNARYIYTTRKTAEMIKYAANVTLTGQVAIANELFQICEAMGVKWDEVKEAILLDPRIGRNIDVPGPDGQMGFGGKCFPKDLNALIYLARQNHYRPYLLEEMWRLNEKLRKDKDWLRIEGATSDKL